MNQEEEDGEEAFAIFKTKSQWASWDYCATCKQTWDQKKKIEYEKKNHRDVQIVHFGGILEVMCATGCTLSPTQMNNKSGLWPAKSLLAPHCVLMSRWLAVICPASCLQTGRVIKCLNITRGFIEKGADALINAPADANEEGWKHRLRYLPIYHWFIFLILPSQKNL